MPTRPIAVGPALIAARQLPSSGRPAASLAGADAKTDRGELRQAFDSFVGETFYGQMLKAMRTSLGKPAYFDGGRAEEIFQGQLDQVLTEEMTKADASTFTGPMFELFQLNRS